MLAANFCVLLAACVEQWIVSLGWSFSVVFTLRHQVPKNLVLSQILTYLTTVLNPSTVLRTHGVLLDGICSNHIKIIIPYSPYMAIHN